MEVGKTLMSGIIIIILVVLVGNFINNNAEQIFGKSFITLILKNIGFVAANIDMIILIIICITGFTVFTIINDVSYIKDLPEDKILEKHKIIFKEANSEGLSIFRGSGF